MTDDQILISQIHELPESLKIEVAQFVKNLKHRVSTESGEKHRRRKAGSHPGMFIMAPDFDEPLEEFEEYM